MEMPVTKAYFIDVYLEIVKAGILFFLGLDFLTNSKL